LVASAVPENRDLGFFSFAAGSFLGQPPLRPALAPMSNDAQIAFANDVVAAMKHRRSELFGTADQRQAAIVLAATSEALFRPHPLPPVCE